MIAKRFLAGGINDTTHAYMDTTPVVGFTTAYDKSSNKFYERELHVESRSHLYQPFNADGTSGGGYDSIDRLRQYQRGTLSSTSGSGGNGGGSVVTSITLPNTDLFRDYDLDGLGNWHTTDFTPVGGSFTTDLRQHNKLNQITTRKIDADPKTPFTYDLNGNLTDDGVRLYAWDALNRLKQVRRKSDNALIAAYTYDARGFRIRKIITNGGLSGSIPNGTTDFIYNSGWQCVEERDGSNTVQKQYVWGIYIDELVQQKNVATIHSLTGDLYPLQDLLYRTTALTDDSGDIVETYDTDAYGNTLIFNAAGTGGDWWADDATQADDPTNVYIYTGRRYDPEMEIYYYRARYYDPTQGRFISQDRLISSNLYIYVLNMPSRGVDPSGLYTLLECQNSCHQRYGYAATPALGICLGQCAANADPNPPGQGPPVSVPYGGHPDVLECKKCEDVYKDNLQSVTKALESTIGSGIAGTIVIVSCIVTAAVVGTGIGVATTQPLIGAAAGGTVGYLCTVLLKKACGISERQKYAGVISDSVRCAFIRCQIRHGCIDRSEIERNPECFH